MKVRQKGLCDEGEVKNGLCDEGEGVKNGLCDEGGKKWFV